LNKTKKDKDKAIRIIVQLIGKERVATFLNRHAGSPDILDRLLEHFSNSGDLLSSGMATSPGKSSGGMFSPKGGKAMPSYKSTSSASVLGEDMRSSPTKTPQKSPALYRSRIDEYYRTAITGRDV